jgi:hypothetical protein
MELTQSHLEMIVRTDQNTQNLVKVFDQHILDDKLAQTEFYRQIEEIKINKPNKYLYMVIGAWFVISLAIRIIFRA